MLRRLLPLIAISAVLGVSAPAYAASAPSVATGSATSITQTSAVLNGSVNPEGSATKYFFRWGPTTLYGATSATHSLAAGTTTRSVQVTASKLLPGTVYHYQLIASNAFGTTFGKDRTFKTAGHPPPNPITGPATVTGRSTVTLTGLVNTEGLTTKWYFRWGLSAGRYFAQSAGGTLSASSKPVSVSQAIGGLTPGTTFHYELVAYHTGSVLRGGGDQTFTTFPIKRVTPKIHARVRPHHAPTKPYIFNVSGSVRPPGFPPGFVGCYGTVSIHFMAGRRIKASALPAVQANCTFAVQVRVQHIKRTPRRLWVWVHFRGNNYLAPRTLWRRVRVG